MPKAREKSVMRWREMRDHRQTQCKVILYSLFVTHKKWENAPLLQVTALVRFDVVLSLQDQYSAIQNNLRRHGFIGAEQFQRQTLVQQMTPQGMRVGQQSEMFWNYFDPKIEKVFTISDKQLSYATSAYESIETFLKEFEAGLLAIKEVLPDGVLIRHISLRYTDWMIGSSNLPLNEQVNSLLLGFELSGKMGSEVLSVANDDSGLIDITFRASSGTLSLNALQEFADQKPLIPRLNQPEDELLETNQSLVINIRVAQEDVLQRGHQPPMLEDIPAKLVEFHNYASNAFKDVLTDAGFARYRGY
ncbi:TIGR04255 family protein [Deinococcus altitudinis]|uniref:TIGR04255 family protein n=1 Tax=Deinococcus altitudinis TaxID=468914 RepID=UPI003892C9D9